MKENRDWSIKKILEAEGGYVDHPRDPGGCTNMGITLNTLRYWRSTEVTCMDVKLLTEEEAVGIYAANYWDAVKANYLPTGLDLLVFDMAVNAGPRRAARMLQKMVGVDDDGTIGPITLKAVGRVARAEAGIEKMIHQYSAARRGYYRSLSNYDTFGRGWMNRTDEKEKEAVEMLRNSLADPENVGVEPKDSARAAEITQLRYELGLLTSQLKGFSDRLGRMEQ